MTAHWNLDEMPDTEAFDCSACLHPFDPHVLVALTFHKMLGVDEVPASGVVLCPECDCASTWSVAGVARPEMPPAQEVERIRDEIFRR